MHYIPVSDQFPIELYPDEAAEEFRNRGQMAQLKIFKQLKVDRKELFILVLFPEVLNILSFQKLITDPLLISSPPSLRQFLSH